MASLAYIQILDEQIRAATEPDSFLCWLGTKAPNDEYLGIDVAVRDMAFAPDEGIETTAMTEQNLEAAYEGNVEAVFTEQEFRDIAEDSMGISRQEDELLLTNTFTHEVILRFPLSEWVIDLDKLALFQRSINQLPLLCCQVQQYLLYRWGLDEVSLTPSILEHWDS